MTTEDWKEVKEIVRYVGTIFLVFVGCSQFVGVI